MPPFDFDRVNLSGELWLAEGFTEYYGGLVLSRAGLVGLDAAAATLGRLVSRVPTISRKLAAPSEATAAGRPSSIVIVTVG